MSEEYRPQASEIEALLARARTLTPDEIERLGAASADAADGLFKSWHAAYYAASDAYRLSDRDLVWVGAWGAAGTSFSSSAHGALSDAVEALIVRDLVGKSGFKQSDYDALTGPWRKVIGKVHPDDTEV